MATRQGVTTAEDMKRYNLVLPMRLFNELEALAVKRGDPVVTVLKQFIRLGLAVASLEDNPDAELIIREGDTERKVMLF